MPIAQPERADAARNRVRILAATRELVAVAGACDITVARVADSAGVGVGTVVRRFGDKAGLLFALIDEDERQLQEAVLRGPPPLGPGATPAERLTAFLDALIGLVDEHADLLLASAQAKPGSWYRTGAYAAWHQHAALLLGQLRPEADASLLAHVLLGPLAAEPFHLLRRVEGRTRAELCAGLADYALGRDLS